MRSYIARAYFRGGIVALQPRFWNQFTNAISPSHFTCLISVSNTQSLMNIDPSSSPASPAVRDTSLPPSSAPGPSLPSNGGSTPRRAPRRDALAFDDEEGGGREHEEATSRRRRKARGQMNLDIPIVRDAVGESVREAFETFIKEYAIEASQLFTSLLIDVSDSRKKWTLLQHLLRMGAFHLPQMNSSTFSKFTQ